MMKGTLHCSDNARNDNNNDNSRKHKTCQVNVTIADATSLITQNACQPGLGQCEASKSVLDKRASSKWFAKG